jgi:hypothetical protein
MRNNNHLPYKGRQNLEFDNNGFYERKSSNNFDDVADDLDDFVILTARQGGKVIIWTVFAVGVYMVVNPIIVGAMEATSRTVEAATTLASDVGGFLSEVAYPLFWGAIIFCFLKVVRHA